jgi:hypothetical protein
VEFHWCDKQARRQNCPESEKITTHKNTENFNCEMTNVIEPVAYADDVLCNINDGVPIDLSSVNLTGKHKRAIVERILNGSDSAKSLTLKFGLNLERINK